MNGLEMGTYYGGGGNPGPVRVMCECTRGGGVSERQAPKAASAQRLRRLALPSDRSPGSALGRLWAKCTAATFLRSWRKLAMSMFLTWKQVWKQLFQLLSNPWNLRSSKPRRPLSGLCEVTFRFCNATYNLLNRGAECWKCLHTFLNYVRVSSYPFRVKRIIYECKGNFSLPFIVLKKKNLQWTYKQVFGTNVHLGMGI